MQQRMASELRAVEEPFALLPHHPNFIQPLSHFKRSNPSASPTGRLDRSTEAMFQLSFKFPLSKPLTGSELVPFFAYTGRAWWQVYDSERSRPFREYNHEPELFVGAPISGVDALGWSVRAITAGFNHQSNGRSVPDSRSWNRLFTEFYADHGSSTWSTLKLWYRIPEKSKATPLDSKGDDNPDITRYMGHFEFRLGHVRPQSHKLTLTARKSFASGGKGALQLDWSHPVPYAPNLRWYASVFDGYGDSLIDYNQRVRRVGLGLMINDWF
jgi:phospholipase A1/A2